MGLHRETCVILVALVAATSASAATMVGDPAATCSAFVGSAPNSVQVESATLEAPAQLVVADRAPTPSERISPALPTFCKVLGYINATDPSAPPIKFEVNLPIEWNGRSLQYGGGGFNGVLVTGLGLPPAYPYDKPSPLVRH